MTAGKGYDILNSIMEDTGRSDCICHRDLGVKSKSLGKISNSQKSQLHFKNKNNTSKNMRERWEVSSYRDPSENYPYEKHAKSTVMCNKQMR